MPIYNYKALKGDGGSATGVIDADSPKDARLKLKSRKLHVSELVAVGFKEEGARKLRVPFFTGSAQRELPIITRQLATLLASGIPLMGAISALVEQAEDPKLKRILMDVRERVSQGTSFSDALAQHSYLFSELFVNMVRAGEASGALDKILFRLADYLHTQRKMKSKIVAALTYPIIMLLVGTTVIFILMAKVVPEITTVITKQRGNAALPLPTDILIGVSDFVAAYWWVMLGFLVLAGLAIARYRKTAAGRLYFDGLLLSVPVLGNLVRKSVISRFALTFATLLESGLPVLDSLNVVKKVVNNQVVSNVLDDLRKKISEGADMSTPLKNSKVFPPVVGYMIAVGEESGRLEELLKKVAETYDEEVEIAAQRLTSLLEPLMIVGMAVVVGFIVLSILLPILEMSNV